jgi:hypothetical protein
MGSNDSEKPERSSEEEAALASLLEDLKAQHAKHEKYKKLREKNLRKSALSKEETQQIEGLFSVEEFWAAIATPDRAVRKKVIMDQALKIALHVMKKAPESDLTPTTPEEVFPDSWEINPDEGKKDTKNNPSED